MTHRIFELFTKRFFNLIFALLLVFTFSNCKYGTNNVFYTENDVNNRVEKLFEVTDQVPKCTNEYSVVIITDTHFGAKKGIAPKDEFLKWLSQNKDSKNIKFCLCLGDVADHGYENEMKSFSEFTQKIKDLEIPVFNSAGNHDLYNSGWDYWKDFSFPHTSFYKFKTDSLSWYSLDTGTGVIGKKQFSILKEKLSQDEQTKIVFTHYPLYSNKFIFNMDDTNERNRLIDLLATNDVMLYLNGHLHRLETYKLGKMTQYTLPSFRYQRKWALLQINEETKDFNLDIFFPE